jgi:hypothetical protein
MKYVAAVVLACAFGTASAADGFYFGVSGGQARYEFERPPLMLSIVPPSAPAPILVAMPGLSELPPLAGFGSSPTPAVFERVEAFWIPGRDTEATSWNLLAGYRFSEFFAIEAAYHDFGSLSEHSPAIVPGPVPLVEVHSKMETTGASLALLGHLPLMEGWSLYVRLGALFADQKVTRRFPDSTFKDSYDSEAVLYGIGTDIELTARWSLRIDYQRYDGVGSGHGIGKADVELLSASVLFSLGG